MSNAQHMLWMMDEYEAIHGGLYLAQLLVSQLEWVVLLVEQKLLAMELYIA